MQKIIFLAEMSNNPVELVSDLSDELLQEAGRLKSENPISLADALALALANRTGARLMTCDHHEMDGFEI